MTRIFFSYRRDDGPHGADRLADALLRRFESEELFVDVVAIASGSNFEERIQDALAQCTAFIAVIGPNWLTTVDGAGRPRLLDPRDYVRFEIAAALRRRDVLIVPVVVGGAVMPQPSDVPTSIARLTEHQNLVLDDNHFRSDVAQLEEMLSRELSWRARRQRSGRTAWTPGEARQLMLKRGQWSRAAADAAKRSSAWVQTASSEVLRRVAAFTDVAERSYVSELDPSDIRRDVAAFLRSQGLETQVSQVGQGLLVQARADSSFRQASLVGVAINVRLNRDGHYLTAAIAAGKWSRDVVATGAGLKQIAATSAGRMIPGRSLMRLENQLRLLDDTFDVIEELVGAYGGREETQRRRRIDLTTEDPW